MTQKYYKKNIIISQIELWEADKMLNKLNFLETLNYSMNNYKNWLMNMSSIKCGKTYFVTKLQNIKNILHNCLSVVWSDNISITNRLYLRKEVIKNCGWDK